MDKPTEKPTQGTTAPAAGATAPTTGGAAKPPVAPTGENKSSPTPPQTTTASAGGGASGSTKQISDEELDKARAENDSELTGDQAAALDVADLSEQEQFETKQAFEHVAALILDAVPATTPDSHTVWGYSGTAITLGDLRKISRCWRMGSAE